MSAKVQSKAAIVAVVSTIVAYLLHSTTETTECPDADAIGPGGWCVGTSFEDSLPPALGECNIARRPMSDLFDMQRRANSHRNSVYGDVQLPDEPTIFTNATADWPALHQWERQAMFSRNSAADSFFSGTPQQLTMKQFQIPGSSVNETSIQVHLKSIRQNPDVYLLSKLAVASAIHEDAPLPTCLNSKVSWQILCSTNSLVRICSSTVALSVLHDGPCCRNGPRQLLHWAAAAQV